MLILLAWIFNVVLLNEAAVGNEALLLLYTGLFVNELKFCIFLLTLPEVI